MHNIEPYFKWRDDYTAEDDDRSPFYGREYSEFLFTSKIYNYYIHPQWDEFGSPTLYLKILFVDYQEKFAIIELIGEWNDCINNDIMWLKTEIANHLMSEGIIKFILIGENVLNFHSSDNCYYEEWFEELSDEGGWISALNFRQHVIEEMIAIDINHYVNLNDEYDELAWRKFKPNDLILLIEAMIMKRLSC